MLEPVCMVVCSVGALLPTGVTLIAWPLISRTLILPALASFITSEIGTVLSVSRGVTTATKISTYSMVTTVFMN